MLNKISIPEVTIQKIWAEQFYSQKNIHTVSGEALKFSLQIGTIPELDRNSNKHICKLASMRFWAWCKFMSNLQDGKHFYTKNVQITTLSLYTSYFKTLKND